MEVDTQKKRKRQEPEMEVSVASSKQEKSFETTMFEGLLNMVFQHLYDLPLSRSTFNCLLVNKRWSANFQHPLQTFDKGEFTETLAQHPPSFYAVDEKSRQVIQNFSSREGMTKQLLAVKEEGDEAREEFVKQEMLVHTIKQQQYPNKRLNKLVERLFASGDTEWGVGKWVPKRFHECLEMEDENDDGNLKPVGVTNAREFGIIANIRWAQVWLVASHCASSFFYLLGRRSRVLCHC
eukprot:TRINITY_DN4419_c0_g1_i2.p1 TRINITY_DN4419_c0_g1~~TRINITY_DN4419_c0_g1_i2.p1  ORF type:complete len:237 (+),score=43.17 TRINITY_DN4419_c0_g1_i2:30-740(+)